MVDSAAQQRDLLVLTTGMARLVLLEPGHDEAVVGDVGVGDVVGLLDTSRDQDYVVAVRAVTDCVVAVVAADVVGEISSRHSDVVAAFNRLVTTRQRRIRRLLERRHAAAMSAPASGRP